MSERRRSDHHDIAARMQVLHKPIGGETRDKFIRIAGALLPVVMPQCIGERLRKPFVIGKRQFRVLSGRMAVSPAAFRPRSFSVGASFFVLYMFSSQTMRVNRRDSTAAPRRPREE
jgi:hypothetical protein